MSHSFINYPSSGIDAGIVQDLTPAATSGTPADAVMGTLKRLADRMTGTTGYVPGNYLGQIATGCWFPTLTYGTGITVINSRTAHYARDNITSLQVAWSNYTGPTETGTGGSMTIEAAVEYPVGTITRITFSGVNVQTIANGQNGALSDACSVTIPKGAMFYIRSYAVNASGVPLVQFQNASPVSSSAYGTSGSSLVMGGTISGGIAYLPPAVIIGTTRRPSVFIVGDSITFGQAEGFDDLTGDCGLIARSIGVQFGYTASAFSGSTTTQFNSSSSNRRAMIGTYFTHVINALGYNDGWTMTTNGPLMDAFRNLSGISGLKIWKTTITPQSTSTDSWATVTNQTAVQGPARALLNQQIIAGLPGYAGCFDVSAEVESSPYSGIWRVDLGVPTSDGTHPNLVITRAIRRSKAINTALIVR